MQARTKKKKKLRKTKKKKERSVDYGDEKGSSLAKCEQVECEGAEACGQNDMCNVAYKRHGMRHGLLDEVASLSPSLRAQEKEEENQQAMLYT